MADLSVPSKQLEFSRPLELGELEHGEVVRELGADAVELAALQTRYGVDEVRSASAQLTVSPQPQGAVKVTGVIRAEICQSCVVTLEPVQETLEETISVNYLPPGAEEPADSSESDLESEEEFEAFDGVCIDLGELTAQQIAAAIDPYPRKDGVTFGNQGQLRDNEPEERDNPFAVLQKLKDGENQTQDP